VWKFVNDARLRTKLLAIALVPLLGLAYFATRMTLERRDAASEASRLGGFIELSIKIGSLLHETQKERGATAIFVSSAGKKFGTEMLAQRRETDRRISELKTFIENKMDGFPERVQTDLRSATSQLESLETMRARASQLNGAAPEFIAYYTAMNENLLDAITSIASTTSDARLSRTTSAYAAFLGAKEKTGLERAQLANVFTNKAFAQGQLFSVASLITEQKAYLRTFNALAAPEAALAYKTKEESEAFARTATYRKSAIDGKFEVEPAVWFDTITGKINGMKEIEDLQAQILLSQVGSIVSESRRAVVASTLLAIGITAVVVFFALAIVRSITGPMAQAVAVLQSVAAGDLTGRLEVLGKDEVGQMAQALNEAIHGIQTAIEGVRDAANAVATAAQQLNATAEEVSSGAQEQASGLEETAASIEEITCTAKQNADSARHANELAAQARQAAENGGRVVSGASGAMSQISDSSKAVSEIIATIDEIAFQINLLSLNAAVEAARAGEQGRGFGVIASEVRDLAQRSAAASKQIRSLIHSSVRNVQDGTELVQKSGETLTAIVGSVKNVTELVAQIAEASREQATGVEQVSRTISEMDRVTQGNATHTEELSATAESLSGEAARLTQLVGRFRLPTDGESRVERPAKPVLVSQNRKAA